MDETFGWADLEALDPEWIDIFGDTIPRGFGVGPAQVPILRECIEQRSQAPLEACIEGLGTDIVI